jgi:hypothetical protein
MAVRCARPPAHTAPAPLTAGLVQAAGDYGHKDLDDLLVNNKVA